MYLIKWDQYIQIQIQIFCWLTKGDRFANNTKNQQKSKSRSLLTINVKPSLFYISIYIQMPSILLIMWCYRKNWHTMNGTTGSAWHTMYGTRGSAWHTMYGTRGNAWHTMYGTRGNAWHTMYGTRGSAWHTMYGRRCSAWHTMYGTRSSAWHTMYGTRGLLLPDNQQLQQVEGFVDSGVACSQDKTLKIRCWHRCGGIYSAILKQTSYGYGQC